MRKYNILIILTLFLHSLQGQNSYSSLWESVNDFEKDGLSKSALKVVNSIAQKAEKEKNDVQLIKSLIYQSKYFLKLEEEAELNVVKNFNSNIEKSSTPTKNLLQCLLGDLYWQYFKDNRYRFYQRTNVNYKVDKQDFRTWDLQTLLYEIHTCFQHSLQNKDKLQKIDLAAYDGILILQKDSKLFRPTLYDLIAHHALEFYKTNEDKFVRPSFRFKLDNENLFSVAEDFSAIDIQTRDTISTIFHTLKIYQDLIKFHSKNKQSFALAAVNIERLKFIKNKTTLSNKDELYLSILEKEKNKFPKSEYASFYRFEVAQFLYNRGYKYDPKTNKTYRWEKKKALQICEAIIKDFPKGKITKKCKELKHQILKKSVQLQAESFIPIQKPSKVLVTYKNIDILHFKIYKITNSEYNKLKRAYKKEEELNIINELPQIKTFSQTLINEDDYQRHSCEVIIPKLNNGTYLIFVEYNDKFKYNKIQVTDFALVEKSNYNRTTYQVINRLSGEQVKNASVTVSFIPYNKRIQKPADYKTLTDKNGEFTISESYKSSSSIIIEINKKEKSGIFTMRYYHNSYKYSQNNTQYQAFLFLDRSIYRPGQVVYYKGIVIKKENKKSEVLPNSKVEVSLLDINHQILSTTHLTTNGFGSLSGNFTLPAKGLTGRYQIRIKGKNYNFSSYSYFNMEEYKRPKFEVKFIPIKKTYQVNDNVTVSGDALGYAGNKISKAKVEYHIKRVVKLPRWCYWFYPPIHSSSQEIAFGETMTDNTGRFNIDFKAIPDEKIDPKNLPIFHYEVTAKVTDINGETHSKHITVFVGYHTLNAQIIIADRIDKSLNEQHKLSIVTKNLNNEFIASKGSLKIYKLNPSSYILRPRPWKAPDYKLQSKDDFKKIFPYESYNNEHLRENWNKGKLVFKDIFDTQKTSEVNLKNIKNLNSGLYQVELSCTDKFGNPVKDIARFTLYDKKDSSPADNQLFTYYLNKDSYIIGEQVVLTLGSCARNLNVFLEIEKNKQIVKKQHIHLNNDKKTIQIPVLNEDLGGFSIHLYYAFFNSYKKEVIYVKIPYPKKDLQIETFTHRNKLQPGEEETWSFKIKGLKGEKIFAELLASMYDMSLDQFKRHKWNFSPNYFPTYYSIYRVNMISSFNTSHFYSKYHSYSDFKLPYTQQYDRLNWFGFRLYSYSRMYGRKSIMALDESVSEAEEASIYMSTDRKKMDYANGKIIENEHKVKSPTIAKKEIISKESDQEFDLIYARKNFNETAFFYPHLKTDKEGNISFSFTMPESLTRWKTQLLAHTKSLYSTTKTIELVTQKELMVIPNIPRFFRSGDEITLSSKIANLSGKELKGSAQLELYDAFTHQKVISNFDLENPMKTFSIDSNENAQVSWQLSIPDNIQAVQYKIIAKAKDFSDGEENIIPILSNRILVTESMPMWVSSYQTKSFQLDNLKTQNSTTLNHHKLTLEFTSNPAWYGVLSLPYLIEFPHECNEQIFARFYANSIAKHIIDNNENIKKVFSSWQKSNALVSNLEKNQELKSLIIQETPWLRDAQKESQQRKNIALLFEKNNIKIELNDALLKLQQNQLPNGAWSWFKGGRENRYITQHIVAGLGHLIHLNILNHDSNLAKSMTKKAIRYLDDQFVEDYSRLKRIKNIDLENDHLSSTQLHYLYLRSFFPEISKASEVENVINYYHSQIKKYWLNRSLHEKGLMALISHRSGDTYMANKILKSLKENSIYNEELGMYWKENKYTWYFWSAPIETHALLIEAFSEIENDISTIDKLKMWLLKNKQTNSWKTTKATTEAIYALLLQGSDWLSIQDMVDIRIGNKQLNINNLEDKKIEAGTGYFKTSWYKNEISPEMAEIKLTNKEKGIAWGGLYWQYFEDIDKIKTHKTPLQLTKKLFLKKNTNYGKKLFQVKHSTKLKLGDIITVRIELRTDRNMEFIHMKDMRAAGLEPINTLSSYKWQDNLGYYESIKDASTNFFFDYLPKGVYVFEYDLKVNNAGNFSSGITTIQSMYAPEFSSHSEGIRFTVN